MARVVSERAKDDGVFDRAAELIEALPPTSPLRQRYSSELSDLKRLSGPPVERAVKRARAPSRRMTAAGARETEVQDHATAYEGLADRTVAQGAVAQGTVAQGEVAHGAAAHWRPTGWIISPLADVTLLVATPLAIVPLVYLAARYFTPETIFLFVAAFASIGHHLPGFTRAYGDRELFRRFRWRFLLAPPWCWPRRCCFLSKTCMGSN